MRLTYRPLGHEWPGEKTPAFERRRYPFKGSWQSTLDLLDRELRLVDAESAVIQIAVSEGDIRLDGMPSMRAQVSAPGVILSFESKFGPLRYACDFADSWRDNVRAIALGLESLRRVDRYGISKRGEQYKGWTQLPPGSGVLENVTLQFATREDAARHIIRTAGNGIAADDKLQVFLVDKDYRDEMFRRASKKHHPDLGGNRADWDTLVEARRVVETEVNR